MPSSVVAQDQASLLRWHLEALARNGLDAINARNFDCSTEPWHHYDKAFEYTTCEVQQNPTTVATSSTPASPRSLDSWLAFQARTAEMYSEYRIKVLDSTCMAVVDKAGFGSVAIHAEVNGIPSGVARAFVMLFDFKRDEGDGDQWKAVKFTSMGGQDVGF